MAIRVTIQGLGEVSLDSVSELVDLKNALEGKKQKAPAEKPLDKPKAAAEVVQNDIFPERKDRLGPVDFDEALSMLGAIKSGPTQGSKLQRLFGIEKAKGLGHLVARVNKSIMTVGMDPAKVIYKDRGPLGRLYKPGRDLDVAISKLTAAAKEKGQDE